MLNISDQLYYIDSVFSNTFIKDMGQFLIELIPNLGSNPAFLWESKVLGCRYEHLFSFDLSHTTNGSFFTKSFIRSNQGTIPVYGASKYEEEVGYGYVNDNLDNVKYFSDCLTWNIDGSIGLFYRKGKFSLSEKVIPLIFKEEYEDVLSKEYVKYAIMSEVMKNPFSFTNKGNKSRLGEVMVKIPIRDNKIDIEKQHIISQYCERVDKKNETIRVLKNDIIENVSKIINKQVIIDG